MFVIGGLQLCYEIKYCFVYIFGKYTVLNLHQATESSRQVSEKNFHDGCYRSSFVFAIEVRHLLQQQQIRFIIQKQISHNIDECEYPLSRIESLRTCTKCFSFALRPFTFTLQYMILFKPSGRDLFLAITGTHQFFSPKVVLLNSDRNKTEPVFSVVSGRSESQRIGKYFREHLNNIQ